MLPVRSVVRCKIYHNHALSLQRHRVDNNVHSAECTVSFQHLP